MNFITKKTSAFGLFLTLSLAALPGCAYDEGNYCDDHCDCEGCSAVEYDDCLDKREDLARRVDNEGCYAYYDDAMACYGSEFECRGGKDDRDGCEYEEKMLDDCLK